MIRAKIILDSVSPVGDRLTTFELTYPRFIHAEFNTHRMLSKNAASSRAIPIEKMIQKVEDDPAEIVWWGKNQSGMQALEELDEEQALRAKVVWEEAKSQMISYVEELQSIGLHKQISNRLLEPFMNITVICTGTEWTNFFGLRCDVNAQPEIQKLAYSMLNEYYNSTPQNLTLGEWHLPYLTEDENDLSLEVKKKLSVAKAARVSYLTQSGKRDYEKDLELYERLYSSGHFSPFEHVATPNPSIVGYSGNFKGWIQFRKTLPLDVRQSYPTKEEVEQFLKNYE